MTSQRQYTTNKVVFAIGALNFEGNIIPHEWYQHLKTSQGTPHMTAIIILSEILYWYRPTVVRDEVTGKLLGYQQKFKGNKLQRSYQSFVDQFGFTKGQVRNAIDYLEKEGYLSREFRNITVGDLHLANVMYLEPVVANIERISKPQMMEEIPFEQDTPLSVEQDTPLSVEQGMGGGVSESTHLGYPGGGTNTEIITETITENIYNTIPSVTHTIPSPQPPTAVAAEPPVPIAPLKEKSLQKKKKQPQKRERLFTALELALCQVCKLDTTVLSTRMYGRVRAAGKALEGQYTPEQLYKGFGEGSMWYKVWPGNEPRPPRPEEVLDKIKDMLSRPELAAKSRNSNCRHQAEGQTINWTEIALERRRQGFQ